MKLNETVLQKLAEGSTSREGRQTLAVPDQGAGWTVVLTVDRQDDLSCAVWEMKLQRTVPAPAGASLDRWANRAAAQVTGLLERLKVYEIDAKRNEALLRSAAPTRRGEDVYYYEVLLRGTAQATARRFHGGVQKNKRKQAAFVLTHEQLAKFAADIAAD